MHLLGNRSHHWWFQWIQWEVSEIVIWITTEYEHWKLLGGALLIRSIHRQRQIRLPWERKARTAARSAREVFQLTIVG